MAIEGAADWVPEVSVRFDDRVYDGFTLEGMETQGRELELVLFRPR